MLEVVKQLRDLQNLEITLRESAIVHAADHPEALELRRQVQSLRGRLNADALSRYDRLSRQGLGVVHVRGGMCMACNLTVVQGDLNRMRAGKMEPVCPNCGVYLDV